MTFWTRKKIIVSLLLVLLFITSVNAYWLNTKQYPLTWDEAAYAHSNMANARIIKEYGITKIPYLFFHTGQDKGPIFHFVAIPFLYLYGNQLDPTFIVNALAGIILILSIYAIGKEIHSSQCGLLAAIIIISFPIIIGLSRMFLIDYTLISWVTLTIALMLKTKKFTDKKYSTLLGIAFAIGMLLKISYAVFILPVLVLFLFQIVIQKKTKKDAEMIKKNIFLGSVIAIIPVMLWYSKNLASVLRYSVASTYGSLQFGPENVFTAQEIGRYVMGYTAEIGTMQTLLFVATAIVLLMRGMHKEKWIQNEKMHLILIWMVIPFLVFMMVHNRDYRYNAPLLPAIALFLSYSILLIQMRLKIVLVSLLVIACAGQYLYISFMAREPINPTSIPFLSKFPYNYPYTIHNQDDHLHEVLGLIKSKSQEGTLIYYFTNHPVYNGNSLEYYNRRDSLNLTISSYLNELDYSRPILSMVMEENDQGYYEINVSKILNDQRFILLREFQLIQKKKVQLYGYNP